MVPADGDYTAEQVGALPLAGGTMTGVLGVQPGIKTELGVGLKFFADNPNEAINSGIMFKSTSGPNAEAIVQVMPAMTTFSGDISASARIRGVSNPQTDHDAANKAYVDSKAGGFSVASNAGAHNSIFRGKYLGTSVTAAQYAAIAAGTFDDLFIGDYWTINNIKWRIAAFDYYLGTGGAALATHHAVIVPDTSLGSGKMNNTDTTEGGYIGSLMNLSNIETARTKVNTAFSGHVLTHQFYLSNAVSNGRVSGSTTADKDVVLMSERNVYGQSIMSSECANGNGAPNWFTYDKTQFPLFALEPEFINEQNVSYWLRDVVTESLFASVKVYSFSGYEFAKTTQNIRPAFSIKG